jgi:hypothetical protein
MKYIFVLLTNKCVFSENGYLSQVWQDKDPCKDEASAPLVPQNKPLPEVLQQIFLGMLFQHFPPRVILRSVGVFFLYKN